MSQKSSRFLPQMFLAGGSDSPKPQTESRKQMNADFFGMVHAVTARVLFVALEIYLITIFIRHLVTLFLRTT